ncbi:hypothetical protein KFK09_019103 [Dendrobium nobile]|uniref:Uncharacterized protein n=1 Tax=Dendrobium nobile TaxID=94219 RepID=A0A8T3B314_DENNO|nr:hypothetical protein KFK09_019103 [Dendrobium nobile]
MNKTQELQLRAGRAVSWVGPAQRPGCCAEERDGCVHDGDVVLDDDAAAEAVVPRRDHRAMGPIEQRYGGRPAAGLRGHH